MLFANITLLILPFILPSTAYFVTSQVLALREVNSTNTLVTPTGGLFVQAPASVLGIGANAVTTGDLKASSKQKDKM